MAQLTWKNVDAPNFSAINQALAGAGDAMHRGFQASRQAIEGFEKDQTQAESARLMAATMGVKDPTQLASILGQFNPSYLAPDALKFAAGRPQDIATLASTQASTALTQANTDFRVQATPVQVQGFKLNNENQQLSNELARQSNPLAVQAKTIANAEAASSLTQNVWKRQNEQAEYSAKPAFDEYAARIQTLAASGDPTSLAQARTLQADPEFARRASAAGVKDISAVIDGSTNAFARGLVNRETLSQLGEKEKALAIKNAIDTGFQHLTRTYASPTAALRAIHESEADPQVKADLAKKVQENPTLWRTYSEAEILAGDARTAAGGAQAPQTNRLPQGSALPNGTDFVTYRNQGATRNKPLAPELVQAMSFLPQLGVTMEVTSGGQDGAGTPGAQRTGSTRHDHGGAGDVRFMRGGKVLSWEDPRDVPILQEIVRQGKVNGITGFGAGPGYMNPTTTHIGFGAPAVWGAKGGTPYPALAEAVGSAPAANPGDRVTQALSAAGGQPGFTPTINRGPQIQIGPVAANAPVEPGVATDTPSALIRESRAVTSALQTVNDTNTLDGAFGNTAPLVNDLATRPDKNLKAAEVAAKIHKEVGDNNEGGWIAAKSLPLPVVTDAVNQVMAKYNLSADMAGAFIKNAIAYNPEIFGDARYVDMKAIDRDVKKFIDTDGPNKGKLKAEHLQIVRQKQTLDKNVSDAATLLETAKQEWLAAQGAAQSGNRNIDVDSARKRFLEAQRLARQVADKAFANPNLTANTRVNTGR